MRREIIPPVTLSTLAPLKLRWGVSLQALIRRSRELKIITDRQYTYLNQQLSARGWKKQEPDNLAVPVERPRAFRKMVEVLYGDPVETAAVERFAADACITLSQARWILDLYTSRSPDRPSGVPAVREPGKVLHFPVPRRASDREAQA